jgi:hypothetical protein
MARDYESRHAVMANTNFLLFAGARHRLRIHMVRPMG